MKEQRQLKASITLIRELIARDGWKPEQKDALGRVLKDLRALRKLPRSEQAKGHALLRQVIEELVNAFVKRG